MNRQVIGTRAPDGTTRLVIGLLSGGEHELTPWSARVEGWDGVYDWGIHGPRAVGTAYTILSALGVDFGAAAYWLHRFAADWVACAPRSRLSITRDELEAWVSRESAKDLTMLGRAGAGQGG